IWWVLGGLAVGGVMCVIPVAGLLVWWLISFRSQPASTPVVAGSRQGLEEDNPPPDQNQQGGEQLQNFPQFDLPRGAGPLPPGNRQPLAAPAFKPIVIPQPSAPHLNIRPPALPEERVVRPLPSTVSDVAVGGGGRFLILYLSRERKLAIFDVNTARVVKYLSF